MGDVKKKRHRVIDPAKARAAAGGGIGWCEAIQTPDPSPAITAEKDGCDEGRSPTREPSA